MDALRGWVCVSSGLGGNASSGWGWLAGAGAIMRVMNATSIGFPGAATAEGLPYIKPTWASKTTAVKAASLAGVLRAGAVDVSEDMGGDRDQGCGLNEWMGDPGITLQV